MFCNRDYPSCCPIDPVSYSAIPESEAYDIIASDPLGTLCVCDCNQPYAAPVCCELRKECGCPVLYLSASENGREVRAISNNKNVCVQFEKRTPCGLCFVTVTGKACVEQGPGCRCGTTIKVKPGCVNARKYN